MNSSPSSVMSRATPSHGSRMRENTPRSREVTSPIEKLEATIKTRDEEPVQHKAQVQVSADNLRDDLVSMRKCLTCSICDQLLYEPWILQCGHTYCYSCLCQWFTPNKRKKTCPECRALVKQIPAPAFLIKNMVEIFIQRGQLMPGDETIEQHKVRNAEETEMVEKDKNGPEGLFKGTFPLRHGELWHDEADGILRCPSCGHEHEGGPTCGQCGAEFDNIYGFSDAEDDGDLSDFDIGYGDDTIQDEYHEDMRRELELEAELHRATEDAPNVSHLRHNPFAFGGPIHQRVLHSYHAHQRGHRVDDLNDDSDDPTNSDISNQENSDDEDAGSLEDFIENDDEDSEPAAPPPRRARQRVVIISDEDDDDDDEEDSDDEGGAITNRRRPRSGWVGSSETPSRAISISADENGSTPPRSVLVSDDDNGSSVNGSEFGDEMVNHEARRLRASGGWSPLDEGEDDDTNRLAHGEYGDYTTTDDERASDESDSDTIGNPNSEGEEDDRPQGGLRRMLNYDYEEMDPNFDGFSSSVDGDATPIDYAGMSDGASNNHGSENEHYDYDTDGDIPPSMDRDGDTEMSVSPGASRSSRDVSVESNLGENLGVANEVAGDDDDDDDDSDSSIRPPPRRQPRNNAGHQQYNSRISMLFAEHQNTVRNARNPNVISYWEDEDNRDVREELPSGNRRRAYHHPLGPSVGNHHHRTMQPLGIERIRTSRGSSPPRLVPTYGRTGRSQRQ
ncbi:hypothetical protein EAE96_002063 [Botrytis aclada]|nr:hypothetical protein EAE96_002063 [Botrytis aclada]